MLSPFTDRLLNWYASNARRLPWRGTQDPYAIWVSEIMLQQTRVDTVVPYYNRWMEQFPDIHSLADAPLQAVLVAWEGLGYYSRARNLHRAAQLVVAEYSGTLPSGAKELQRLPGIGRYTAGAIRSFAFHKDAPILDTNVRRVFQRFFGISGDPFRSPTKHQLWWLAKHVIPTGRGYIFNQALMDFGALVCTARKPQCPRCIYSQDCRYYSNSQSP